MSTLAAVVSPDESTVDGLKQFVGKGTVYQTSLNTDDEAKLREALEAVPA